MLVEQAYQKYLNKVEKNGVNDNISTDRGRFVILFNESQNKIQESLLDRRGEDDIRYIQKLLVTNKKISFTNKTDQYYKFPLPGNYFDFANVYASCSKDSCISQKVYLFSMKEEDANEVLQDEFNKPSFTWRESPFTIGSDAINVYYDDFSVDSIVLSYYRYATQIALLDPEDPESRFNETQKIEFDDKLVDRILSVCAGEFELNNEDPFYQQQLQRAVTKI